MHETESLIDKALGPTPFRRGFPLRTAADSHPGIDEPARDLVRGRGSALPIERRVENVEEEVQPMTLKGCRLEAGYRPVRRRSGKFPLEPANGCEAEIEPVIAHEDIGQRRGGASQPDMMRSVGVS